MTTAGSAWAPTLELGCNGPAEGGALSPESPYTGAGLTGRRRPHFLLELTFGDPFKGSGFELHFIAQDPVNIGGFDWMNYLPFSYLFFFGLYLLCVLNG